MENIKMTIEGENIEHQDVRGKIESIGGSIHSVDEVVCGSKTVEKVHTPQDK